MPLSGHCLGTVSPRRFGQCACPCIRPDADEAMNMHTVNGIVYGIKETGDLEWYHHDGHLTGEFCWQGPNKVGTGWGDVARVFCGDDGVADTVGHETQPPLEQGEPQQPSTSDDLIPGPPSGEADTSGSR